MTDYRDALPQLHGETLLTDSGIETDVIYGAGRDLPSFAVFPLLDDEPGRAILDRYYRSHLDTAALHGFGYQLETPSWRSTPDWGKSLGYSQAALDDLDRRGVEFLRALRASAPEGVGSMPISGNIGPRGDGYAVDGEMPVGEARRYHGQQVGVFADARCDVVSGCTMTYSNEALGLALAARDHGVPVMLYFTLETDGRLPDGSRLGDAIEEIDRATDGSVAYYGINCAHPEHMLRALAEPGEWMSRIKAIRGNASRKSHAELDEATELDAGDPDDFAAGYLCVREILGGLSVFGGCCGTDVRHVRAVASAVAGA